MIPTLVAVAVAAYRATDPNWIADVRRQCRGDGPDVLLEMSGHPGAIERLMPGSTAEKMIGHAECPVLVVRN